MPMLHLVDATNRSDCRTLIDAAYRLRHRVFVEEMGWRDLAREDGRERDGFDDDHAVEMIVEERGEVIGYQRLLPTMRPYLLSNVYPFLCDGPLPASPQIWEWTRFAVAKEARGDGRSLGPVALALVTSFVEWGLANDVLSMVIEMAPVQLLRLVSCHFRAVPLGIVHLVGGAEVLAVEAHFDHRTLTRLRELRASDRPVLSFA